jgi:hypothetical protein
MILQGLRLTSVLRKSEYLRVCFSDKPWLKCIPNHNDYSIAVFHFQLFSSRIKPTGTGSEKDIPCSAALREAVYRLSAAKCEVPLKTEKARGRRLRRGK